MVHDLGGGWLVTDFQLAVVAAGLILLVVAIGQVVYRLRRED